MNTTDHKRELFRIKIPVRITDINYGNHLGNDALVSLLHETRAAWLRRYNLTELAAGGAGMILTELHIAYKAESFYGDELEIILSSNDISTRGFTLHYLVLKTGGSEVITVAEATTKMLCYNYDVKKVAFIPEALKNVLTAEP